MSTKQLLPGFNPSILPFLGRKMYSSDFFGVVLRELIQNALDASATWITIEYDDPDMIITDNGTGIPHIEGLLNVIGESIKNAENVNTIGGYGLAKLAIFGCEYWEFKSISGIFKTGFIYDDSESTLTGTIVTVRFNPKDTPYSGERYIKDYLRLIDRQCEFYLNTELIQKPDETIFRVGDSEFKTVDSRYNGRIAVRVNGLPSFYPWISNLDKTILLDYHVSCSPYDSEYPLTSNRDAFTDSSWQQKDLQEKIDTITRKLQTDKLEEENIKSRIDTMQFKGMTVLKKGNISLGDYREYSNQFYTYKRYLEQLHELCVKIDFLSYDKNLDSCQYGLCDGDDDELGLYSNNRFLIVKTHMSKGSVLSIAIHEFCHFLGYGMNGHDQQFSSVLSQLTGETLQAIFNGDFRK